LSCGTFDYILLSRGQLCVNCVLAWEIPTQSICNMEDEGTENSNHSTEEEVEFQEKTEVNNTQKSASVSSQVPSTSHARPTSPTAFKPASNKRSKTSKQNKTQTDFMNYCKNQLESKNEIDEFDAAAISWAKKIKKMNPTQAIYADMLINQVLNKGLLNQLTETTIIMQQSPVPLPLFSPPSLLHQILHYIVQKEHLDYML
ncbi:unnamed protein product, partial [Acanthoscelides obtectus]